MMFLRTGRYSWEPISGCIDCPEYGILPDGNGQFYPACYYSCARVYFSARYGHGLPPFGCLMEEET